MIRGTVPDTLATTDIDKVCYLSIDMNIVKPEIAAIEFADHEFPALNSGVTTVTPIQAVRTLLLESQELVDIRHEAEAAAG